MPHDPNTSPETQTKESSDPMTGDTNTVETHHGEGELRIVVGVDGSECAKRAVDFAAHEASRWGALLHVVSAYEIPPDAGWMVVPMQPFVEAALASVDSAVARAHELEPTLVTKGESTHGSAGNVLVAASQGASLLVVGSRGRGEVRSLVLGSVSEHCVHHASCPVTIVGAQST
jgi:nucleotide-binding universal stress UspA family protein